MVIAMLEGYALSQLLLSRAGELNTVVVFVSVLAWVGRGTCGGCC